MCSDQSFKIRRVNKVACEQPASILLDQGKSLHAGAAFETGFVAENESMAFQHAARVLLLGRRIERTAFNLSQFCAERFEDVVRLFERDALFPEIRRLVVD